MQFQLSLPVVTHLDIIIFDLRERLSNTQVNALINPEKSIKTKKAKIKVNLMRDFIDFIKNIIKDGDQ